MSDIIATLAESLSPSGLAEGLPAWTRALVMLGCAMEAVYFGRWAWLRITEKGKHCPGPVGLPLLGSGPSILGQDVHEVFVKWYRRYGKNYKFWMEGKQWFVIGDPNTIHQILRSKSFLNRFSGPTVNEGAKMVGTYMKGIVQNNDLETWQTHRQQFTKALASGDFQRRAAHVSGVNAQRVLADRILRGVKAGGELEVEVNALMGDYTTDTIGMLALNRPMDSISCGTNSAFQATIKMLLEAWTYFTFNPPILWATRPAQVRQYKKGLEEMRNLEMESVRLARSDFEAGVKRSDFVSQLVQAQAEDKAANESAEAGTREGQKDKYSDEFIRQDLREMLLGGSDTTSNLLVFILYYLAKYPELQDRMRRELAGVVDCKEGEELRQTLLNDTPYTTAFIKEVSRLNFAIPLNYRGASEDCFVDGYFFPKGCNVFLFFSQGARDPDFVDCPTEFDPERWLARDPAQVAKANFVSYTFGSGQRACPGQLLAWTQMRTLLAHVIPKAQVSLCSKGQTLQTKYAIANHVVGDELRLKFRAVDGCESAKAF